MDRIGENRDAACERATHKFNQDEGEVQEKSETDICARASALSRPAMPMVVMRMVMVCVRMGMVVAHVSSYSAKGAQGSLLTFGKWGSGCGLLNK